MNDRYPGQFAHEEQDYAPFVSYKAMRGRISMEEMRQDMTDRVNLFAIRSHFDFERLEELLDQVALAIPAMRRIFARPITRLMDKGEIMPVESVRVVNNRTVVHASAHSELWSDLTPDGVKPRKLMTVSYEDDYAIYENLLLVRCVDVILSLVGRNLRILREMLDHGQDLRINLLDRRAHAAYFLALGKLHYGYMREFELYRAPAERCVEKLLYVQRVLAARKHTHLYQHCTGKGQGLELKRTNIFRGHKDYARIWALLKWMNAGGLDRLTEAESGVGEGYDTFLLLLTVFAAEHFGFDFKESETVDFTCFEAVGRNRGWYLMIDTMRCGEGEGVRLTFFKDRLWRALILPPMNDESRERLAQISGADRVFMADPWTMGKGRVHLSRFDLDSFPRIWQILMTGMLMSDTTRSTCPFCGHSMEPFGEEERKQGVEHFCPNCETAVGMRTCPETGKAYPISAIYGFAPDLPRDIDADEAFSRKDLQSAMYFRNVTLLGPGGELLCPFCDRPHQETHPDHGRKQHQAR